MASQETQPASADRPALIRRIYRALRLEKVRYLPWPHLWVPLLGWGGWLRLLGDLIGHRGAGAVIEVTIRRTGRVVRARPGTSDLRVVLQVYGRGEITPPVPVEAASVLDAGANVGMTAGAFLDMFPTAQVLALEPDPENLAALQRNVDDARVTVVQGGLWDADAWLTIANPESASWCRQVREVDKPVPGAMAAFTLDTLAARAGVAHFDILKIDIEGAETRIFVERFRPHFEAARMVFTEAHGPAAQRQVDAFLTSCGFTLARQGDMTVGYRPA